MESEAYSMAEKLGWQTMTIPSIYDIKAHYVRSEAQAQASKGMLSLPFTITNHHNAQL